MAFIEKQSKGGKEYYYLTKTVRHGSRFRKVRVLLSDRHLSGKKLASLAKMKEPELWKKSKADNFWHFSFKAPAQANNEKWVIWERPSNLYLVQIPAEACIALKSRNFDVNWGRTHLFFRNNMVKAAWDKKRMILAGISVVNSLMDKAVFERKMEEWSRLNAELHSQYAKLECIGFEPLSDKEFIEIFRKFHTAFQEWWNFSQVAELISVASENILLDVVPKSAFAAITSPSKKSYTTIEEEKLLGIALKIKMNKRAHSLFSKDISSIKKGLGRLNEINSMLKAHTKEYFWQQNGYINTEPLAVDYFIAQIKEILADNTDILSLIRKNEDRIKSINSEKKKILETLSFGPQYKKLVSLLDFFCIFQDDRKAISLNGNHYLGLLLKEVSRRTGISRALLSWSSPHEIPAILKGGFDISGLRKRMDHCAMIIDDSGTEILTGNKSRIEERKLFSGKGSQKITEFEGIRAQGGKATGKVLKVLDPRKSGNFKAGSILVTTMTSPDFAPLMKKAAAIVTDEGGITSHASIVSRELGIPCVIGTKIATETLESGDIIEVNANHGIVKIIKRKNANG